MPSQSIAIIPARGGSKRIPRKNIRNFCGHPIIHYSINAALESGCFDEVMVSTDDSEIAHIAKRLGASVPFFRSDELSNDFVGTAPVILDVLERYEQLGHTYKYVCCLYPAAPFVTPDMLRESFAKLKKSGAQCIIPIVKYSYPPQRAFNLREDQVVMMYPKYYNHRSQDLEPVFHDAGQFYMLQVDAFREQKKLYCDNTQPIIVAESKVQDIDTSEDWNLAELKFKHFFQTE